MRIQGRRWLLMMSVLLLASCSGEPNTPKPARVEPLTFQLRADGSTALRNGSIKGLSADELTNAIDRYVTASSDRGRAAPTSTGGTRAIDAQQATVQPQLLVVADGNAEHRSLEKLLRISVHRGITRYALRRATGAKRFFFELYPPTKPEGLPGDADLPAIIVQLKSDESGRLTAIFVNDRRLPSIQAVQELLMSILGDERGPGSIQDMASLEMDCDASLHLNYVFEAMEATTGFVNEDGQRIELVKHVIPVSWNEPLTTHP